MPELELVLLTCPSSTRLHEITDLQELWQGESESEPAATLVSVANGPCARDFGGPVRGFHVLCVAFFFCVHGRSALPVRRVLLCIDTEDHGWVHRAMDITLPAHVRQP